MAYTPNQFEYSLKSYDAEELNADTSDLFAVRDSQLENFLKTETTSIQIETDSLQTQINDRLLSSRFRFGSSVITTPAIGGSARIQFSPSYSSSSNLFVVITNGDYPASSAIFSAELPSTSDFYVYRVSGGTTGAGARVNWIVYQL